MINDKDKSPTIQIAVIDTGIGIENEQLDGLFTEFTQADDSISRQYEGSGLGLAICKRLVELLNGKIWAESVYGIGSTFWIHLPYIPARKNIEKSDRNNLPQKIELLTPLKVLVAEDNRVNQLIIQKTLTSLGIEVEIVGNGKEALKANQEHEYDLILMDIRMPVMNGVDAAIAIRQQHKHHNIPIIALTADVVEGNEKVFSEAGMNEFVTKPFNRSDLFIAINRAIENEVIKVKS